MLSDERLSLLVFGGNEEGNEPRAFVGSSGNVSTQAAEALERHGHVWIRGLDNPSPAAVQELARTLAPTLIRYPGGRVDVTGDGTVQRIADPPSALPLHCELAYTPFRPDLCFFACAVPAATGGATLIADGVAVWERLSARTREQLLARRVRYMRVYRTRPWRILFGVETIEELAPLLGSLRDFRYHQRQDGAVHCEYVTAAATRVDGRVCFANSIVGLAKGQTDFDVTWEDGEPFDPALLAELRDALRRSQIAVDWAPGDLVILDNWRYLHGRTAFEGERVIYSAFGYRMGAVNRLRACG